MNKNRLVLEIHHPYLYRLAAKIMRGRPSEFRKNALAQWKKDIGDFFWLLEKLNRPLFDIIPKTLTPLLNYHFRQNAPNIYYVQFSTKSENT
ncbi:hypothetical protein NVP1081O_269 [Vibrio phage 1.081.O._10N.286.52.C2]|nr:hypothetical protein NVP1081O_269 [Vibrio phage 1.081.O._10N.286.52.C2]